MRIAADEVELAFRLLRGIDALSELDDPVLHEIAGLTGVVWVEPGTVVVHEGEAGDAVFLVSEGRVELRVGDRPVEEIGPGRGIGLVQLLSGGVRTETAVALTRTKLVRLTRQVFQRYTAQHPHVARAVQEIVRQRTRVLHLWSLLEGRLGRIDPNARAELLARIVWVELGRGEVLYRAGDPSDAIYLVLGGRLSCDRGVEGSVEVGRGELQGEVSLLAQTPRTSTVTALRNCLLARIDAESFVRLAQRPELAFALARMIAVRTATHRTRRPASGCHHLAVMSVSTGRAARRLVHALAEHLSASGRAIVLDVDGLAQHGVLDNARELAPDHPSWIRFQAWLDRIESEASYVLYLCDPDAPGWTRRCIDAADRVVMVAASGEEVDRRSVAIAGPRRGHDAKRVLALIHPPDTRRPTGTRAWLEQVPVDAHYHLRAGVPADEARLARLLTDRAVGLTLGGGGARGLAHIGVIRAMHELGVPIDHVGGTSMGAIIAAQHAMGLSPEEMVALNRRLARLKPFSDYTLPVISLLRTRRIEASARAAFGTTDIEDLWLPYFAISTNLTQASMVVHDRGPVWVATRASGSLPGIAVPVLLARQLLVDGGVLNNVPADVMVQRAGGRVLAVDVSPKVDQRFQLERLPGPWRYLRDRLRGATRATTPTIVDILLRTTTLASSQHSERIAREVDLLLRPPVDGFGLLDFHRIGPIVDTGYHYALSALAGWSDVRASA